MWDYASLLSNRLVGESPPADGRVAFRIRIGVTGHVDLTAAEIAAVRDPLRRAISRVRHDLIASDASTPIRLAVVSQLAEGADRLAVWEVLRQAAEDRQEADVEVVLPMGLTEFIVAQRLDVESLAEFEWLLERASSMVRIGHPATEEEGYELAAQWLVQRCDVLIAIWRGDPSGGRGGTAETLRLAALQGLPCIWIQPDGDPPTTDNFDRHRSRQFYETVNDLARLHDAEMTSGVAVPGDVLVPLRDSYAELRPFNRGRWYELGYPRPFRLPFDDGLPHVAARRRASVLARWNQRVFKGLVLTISGCAIAAAVVLAFSATYSSKSDYLLIAEPVAFTALFVSFGILHFGRYKERWSSCRMFAERLRSVSYLHAVGADAPDGTDDQLGHYQHPQDWVARAFGEVWERGQRSRSTTARADLDLPKMKSLLAGDWLGGQIHFHDDRAGRDSRMHWRLSRAAVALFVAVWVLAVLHAFGRAHEAATLGLIALPAFVAALGAYDAVGLFAASARTSREMVRALSASQHEMARATSRDELALAARRAALVIAKETGDWESGLWSLEVHLL